MQAIILAAGKGTRMGDLNGSPLPKVMYPLNGIPLIKYSVENVQKAGVKDIIVVVGYQKEKVQNFLGSSVRYAVQEQQLGTGHAVMSAKDFFSEGLEGVLVCYGDMPLYRSDTIRRLIQEYEAQKPVMAMLTVTFERPDDLAYGRIVRNSVGEITSIVEQKDCTPEQRRVKECNPGFYIFRASWLRENIMKLGANNAQKEYYLTDLVEMAISQNQKVVTLPVADESEALGINTPEQLGMAEKEIEKRESGK